MDKLISISHRKFLELIRKEEYDSILSNPIYSEHIYYERVLKFYPTCICLLPRHNMSWKQYYYMLIEYEEYLQTT